MGVKYIKGNVDIISMVVSQWELTGRLNEIEHRFLLEKTKELHESLKLIHPNDKFVMTEDVVPDGLREFSIDVEADEHTGTPADNTATDSMESVQVENHSADGGVEPTQPEHNHIVDEVETATTTEIDVETEQVTEAAAEIKPTDYEEPEKQTEDDSPAVIRRGRLNKNAVRALYDTAGNKDIEDKPAQPEHSSTEPEFSPENIADTAPHSAPAQTSDSKLVADQVTDNINASASSGGHDATESAPADIPEEKRTIEPEPLAEPDTKKAVAAQTASDSANGCECAKTSETTITESKTVILGEIISSGGHVLGETLQALSSRSVATTVTGKISSLRKSIGINDKYLMIKDLFDGDAEAYDNAICTLDAFTTLDDAMLWIYDNYEWPPEAEGTQTLMDLLVRKLS